MVDKLNSQARSKSTGYCARFISNVLESAGFNFTRWHAYDYNKVMKSLPFYEVTGNNNAFQKGDIVVIDKVGKHKYGHVQMFNGISWISDFKQNYFNPFSDKPKLTYKTWRLL